MKSLTAKLLIINIIVMLTFSIFILYQTYTRTNESTTNIVNQQASLALQFDLSIRQYVANYIRPSMYELTEEDEFFPETMSTSYIARSIFEDVRKKFPDYIIKFSSDNPRNPLNQAGPEELEIIKMFNDQPQLNQWEGQIIINEKKYLAKFSARRMVASCIRCHGKPEDAPAALVERYGDTNGFNRKIGDVLGLDTVAIPMTRVVEQRKAIFLRTSFFIGMGIVLLFAVNFLIIRYLIIGRLSEISNHFLNASQETDYRQISHLKMKGEDEIGDLARSFNTMSERLKESYSILNHKVTQRTSELQNEINEHKKAEAQLRQSEERFRLAFQTSPNIITLTSVEDGTYIDINDAFTRLMGYTRDEVIGKSALVLNIWDDIKDRDKLVAGLQQDGVVQSLEAKFKGKDGQIIDGIMSARILDIDNKMFLLATTQDITPIKKSEKDRLNLEIKLQQAQKMESVGRLAGGVAHDFNNMLSIILGNTEIIMEDLDSKNPLISNLKEVQKAAERSTDLTRQLLAFARKQTTSPKILNLNSTIEGMLKMLRRLIGEDIDLSWHPMNTLWAVRIDPSQVDQILANLCINARDSIKDVGKISIETGNVSFDEDYCKDYPEFKPGDYIMLTVSDNGCGMDKETLNNLFEPFFTTKKSGEGTGLGLAMIYGIVKQNNGFIKVYSEVGQGTTFKIYVPKYTGGIKIEKQVPDEKIIQKGYETILLVEDEKSILEMTKMTLERLGYTVLAANTPDEAIQISKALERPIHLLMTDVIMPSMNGRDLSEKILKSFPEMKCLYMSGYTANIIAHRGILDEGLNYISKPFSKQDLSVKLRDILD